MTNVVTAAYAAGDIPNMQESFDTWLETKKLYKPDPNNTAYYRKIYDIQNKLIKNDMKAAFDTLAAIREI